MKAAALRKALEYLEPDEDERHWTCSAQVRADVVAAWEELRRLESPKRPGVSVELNHVRAAIARPPSGFALKQLDLAEQVIDAARNLDKWARGEIGDDGIAEWERLRWLLASLDQSMQPIRETESSDVSERP